MESRFLICLPMILLLGITVLSCEESEKELEPIDQISDEAYGIYSLVINEHLSSEKIVIAQPSSTRVSLDESSFNYQDFDSQLIQIHEDLNEKSVDFENKFKSDTKEIILISSDELSNIFDDQDLNGGWERFHNEYENSGGLIRFSKIAFNEGDTQAVFQISHTSAGLGGAGRVVYLKKQDDNWMIIFVGLIWVS